MVFSFLYSHKDYNQNRLLPPNGWCYWRLGEKKTQKLNPAKATKNQKRARSQPSAARREAS
jgi:hypothetical protein